MPDAHQLFPLLARCEPAELPLAGPDDDDGCTVPVWADAPFPLMEQMREGLVEVSDGAVPVRRAFAAAAPPLAALVARGDLRAGTWRRIDLRRLAEAAVFFGFPEAKVVEFVELGYHRKALARALPAAARAVEEDLASDLLPVPDALEPAPPRSWKEAGVPSFMESVAHCGRNRADVTLKRLAATDPVVAHVLRSFPEVVLAGSAALSAVTGGGVASGDADFFVVGATSKRADAIVASLAAHLATLHTAPNAVKVYHTQNATTFVAAGDVYQVVRRLYPSDSAVLRGFDIPASKVLVRASPRGDLQAWCLPSFLVAVAHRAVWVDPARQSLSYVTRLVKYWAKGFDVLLPGVDRRSLCPALVTTPRDRVHTLSCVALLLRLEIEAATRGNGWVVARALFRAVRALVHRHVGRKGLSDYDGPALRYVPPQAAPFLRSEPAPWAAAPTANFYPVRKPFYEGALYAAP